MHLNYPYKIIEYQNNTRGIKPLISVIVLTYNHENYIKECLDGILAQLTNFEVEIIVGEDDSNDKTRKICLDYAEKHPNKIRLIFHSEKNKIYINNKKTGRFNFLYNYNISRGKYIALCEGDDYWTNPHKLQKQVDFLEANPDYALCFHEVQIKEEATGGLIEDNITRKVPDTTDIRDLARGNYIHTPSVVFRNNFSLPDWFSECTMGDWPLYCVLTGNKKIKKLSDVMAVYRSHPDSMWSAKDKSSRIRNSLHTYRLVLNSGILNPEAKAILQASVKNLQNQLPKQPSWVHRLKTFLKT